MGCRSFTQKEGSTGRNFKNVTVSAIDDSGVTIRHTDLHDGADYTPYEGLAVTGWPMTTIVRGVVIVDDRTLVGRKSHGQHIARDRSDFAKSRAAT